MKIEVYIKKEKEEEPVRLAIENDSRGVKVRAVGSNGDWLPGGALLHISEKGVLLYRGVSSVFGFERDSGGYLALKRDD